MKQKLIVYCQPEIEKAEKAGWEIVDVVTHRFTGQQMGICQRGNNTNPFLPHVSTSDELRNVSKSLIDAVDSKRHQGRSWEIESAAKQLAVLSQEAALFIEDFKKERDGLQREVDACHGIMAKVREIWGVNTMTIDAAEGVQKRLDDAELLIDGMERILTEDQIMGMTDADLTDAYLRWHGYDPEEITTNTQKIIREALEKAQITLRNE